MATVGAPPTAILSISWFFGNVPIVKKTSFAKTTHYNVLGHYGSHSLPVPMFQVGVEVSLKKGKLKDNFDGRDVGDATLLHLFFVLCQPSETVLVVASVGGVLEQLIPTTFP